MIGLSWNYQGFGNPWSVQELHLWVKTKCPSFIFLIETKCKREKVEVVRNKVGFDYSFILESRGFSGRLSFSSIALAR